MFGIRHTQKIRERAAKVMPGLADPIHRTARHGGADRRQASLAERTRAARDGKRDYHPLPWDEVLNRLAYRPNLSNDLMAERDRSLEWRLSTYYCGIQIARCHSDWPHERFTCPLQLRLRRIPPLELARF